NSVAMKCSASLFGTGELALRLPNLLALALFLFYAARLLLGLPAVLALGGFAVLATNSYMLELFTLARGYGLSFGLMLMALFHLVRAAQTLRTRDIVLFHAASVLATLSNFTLLNAHLAGVITLGMVLWARHSLSAFPRKRLLQVFLLNVQMLLLSAAVLWLPIRNTLQANQLDFGSKADFFHSTVHTWAMSLLPGLYMSGPAWIRIYAVIALLVVVALAVVIRRYLRRDGPFFSLHTALPVTLVVLLLICLGSELQHHLFGVDHMIQRFALFPVPLLVLVVVQLMARAKHRGWRHLLSAVVLVAASWSVVASARHFGPYRSMEWQYDVNTRKAIIAIASDMEKQGRSGTSVHVGINWLFEPALNFYRMQWGLDAIQPLDRDGLTPHDAYRLVFQHEAVATRAEGFIPLAEYPESGTILFRAP